MMIGYVTIGARDSEESGRFYDAVLGAIGNERKFADGGWIGYGPKSSDSHCVYICTPFNKQPPTIGNWRASAVFLGSKHFSPTRVGFSTLFVGGPLTNGELPLLLQ